MASLLSCNYHLAFVLTLCSIPFRVLQVLIIGAGPCGLRTAIECAMLGAKTVVLEKRDRFSRLNVLHFWPFLIADLKALGAKLFFGKFCAGAIEHISQRLRLPGLVGGARPVSQWGRPGYWAEPYSSIIC